MLDFDAKYRCIDNSDEGTLMRKYSAMMISGAEKLGKIITNAPKYKGFFEEVGFEEVREVKFQWPFNTWPKGKHYKTLGMWYGQDMKEGLEGITMAVFTRAHGMKKEEVLEMLPGIRKEIDDKGIHAYLPM